MSVNTTVTPVEAIPLIAHALRAKLPVMLHGSPSTAKSSIAHKVADMANLEFIDFRVASKEPVDITGYPFREGGKATYLPFDTFPVEGDELPKGKAGWLLMLDEVNMANRAMQGALYGLILDRLVGQFKLHPKVHIVMAGNLIGDNAIVNPMGTAIGTRMLHLEVVLPHKVWMDWAVDNGIDSRILTYLSYRPQVLASRPEDMDGYTYPCGRTWHFLSKIITGKDDLQDILPLLIGAVGEGAGLEFYSYTQLKDSLPTVSQILANPELCDCPDKPSHRFAMVGLLAESLTVENAPKLVTYILRLPKELQYVLFRLALRRDPALVQNSKIAEWLEYNAEKYLK